MKSKPELNLSEIKNYCSLVGLEEIVIDPKFELSEAEKTLYKESVKSTLKGQNPMVDLDDLWLIKDIHGRNLSHFACASGNVDVVNQLNFKTCFNHKDKFGLQPLHYACASGRIKVIKILLERMIHVNQNYVSIKEPKMNKNIHCSGVELAVITGKPRTVKVILETIWRRDREWSREPSKPMEFDGLNLLHLSVLSKKKEVCRYLCSHAAHFFEVWSSQSRNKTPLELALSLGHNVCAEIILNRLMSDGKITPTDLNLWVQEAQQAGNTKGARLIQRCNTLVVTSTMSHTPQTLFAPKNKTKNKVETVVPNHRPN